MPQILETLQRSLGPWTGRVPPRGLPRLASLSGDRGSATKVRGRPEVAWNLPLGFLEHSFATADRQTYHVHGAQSPEGATSERRCGWWRVPFATYPCLVPFTDVLLRFAIRSLLTDLECSSALGRRRYSPHTCATIVDTPPTAVRTRRRGGSPTGLLLSASRFFLKVSANSASQFCFFPEDRGAHPRRDDHRKHSDDGEPRASLGLPFSLSGRRPPHPQPSTGPDGEPPDADGWCLQQSSGTNTTHTSASPASSPPHRHTLGVWVGLALFLLLPCACAGRVSGMVPSGHTATAPLTAGPAEASGTFNPLHGVLCILRSLYLCAIGPRSVCHLVRDTPHASNCSPKPLYSGIQPAASRRTNGTQLIV